MVSYNDLKIGDRVVILGTVTDISESGVQTIVPDTDAEGFVISKKLPERVDITGHEYLSELDAKKGWNKCIDEIAGERESCNTCKYYDAKERICKNQENLCGAMRPEDGCPDWSSREETRQQEPDK